jgi:protocatechuate 3,4-dioxygenase, alpha subunit
MSDEPLPALVATGSQTIGPFFHVGPGATDRLGMLAMPDTPGEHIRLRVRVLDGDGAPVSDSMVEVWQADAEGRYSSPPPTPDAAPPAFTGFGRLGTSEDGWCTFETIRPGKVAAGSGARQAAHINVCVFARGLPRHLYTRIYFEGDVDLEHDPLLSLVTGDRRGTLVARRPADPATWEFIVRLQGDNETVFFDL